MPHSGGLNGPLPTFLSNNAFSNNSSYESKIPDVKTAEVLSTTPEEKTRSSASQRCMDQARPLKAIYIGAGISGICGAVEFRKQVPDIDLVIYEKNPDLGGTWYENR